MVDLWCHDFVLFYDWKQKDSKRAHSMLFLSILSVFKKNHCTNYKIKPNVRMLANAETEFLQVSIFSVSCDAVFLTES